MCQGPRACSPALTLMAWRSKGREVKCAVAHKAVHTFKARIRQLTRRSGGRSMEQVVQRLRPYMLG